MPLEPALERLISAKLRNTRAQQWELPIAAVRKAFHDLWTPALTGEPVPLGRIEAKTISGAAGDIPARLYAIERGSHYPLMLYFHGGGYVKGGLDEADAFCRNLARTTRHIVLSVDYRLAPEHPFPAALEDAYNATEWAYSHTEELGATAGPMVVCGESAGGNLAAVTCLRALADPRVAIRYQVLLQPVIDFTLSFPSTAMSSAECLVPRAELSWYYDTYYGGQRDPRDPLVSPIYAAELSGLPPALVITAEFDTLRDEAEAYAARLRASGVTATYSCYPGMIHGFLQMRGLVPQADAALEEINRVLS